MTPAHVIILAGGSISSKLGFLRSLCPSPALIPVNTRPLAAYLIDFYTTQKAPDIRLAVNAEIADTVQTELGGLHEKYSLFRLGPTGGVVESLAQACANLPDDDEVIVNLVTTVPTRLAQPGEVLLANQTTRSGHWSGVVAGKDGVQFSYKSSPLPEPSQAFTGVFASRAGALKAALRATSVKNDLLAVVAQLHSEKPLRFTAGDWIDCGHETNYYDAKARLISSRSFNRIQVSLDDGVLTKQSEHGEKLAREVNYVQMLPAGIRVYFPRILASTPAGPGGPATAQMEYYGYPTVAEYFLYWELSADNWRRLFSRLEAALRRFSTYPYAISQAAYADFYFQKTVQRVEEFLRQIPGELRTTLEKETVVNGRRCRSFAALAGEAQQRLAAMYREKDFCVMHGDFCFNNILYDVPSGIVRLIDPRGSFGEHCVGIYGDQKYDLAKLKHSAEHGYDFLVNGLFTLRCDGAKFDYAVAARACSPLVAELSRGLSAALGHRDADIELLTSLLFLSMGPLHAEDRARQLAMHVHGLSLLNRCLEK